MHLNHWDGLLPDLTISLPRSLSPYSTFVVIRDILTGLFHKTLRHWMCLDTGTFPHNDVQLLLAGIV